MALLGELITNERQAEGNKKSKISNPALAPFVAMITRSNQEENCINVSCAYVWMENWGVHLQ